MNFDLPDKLIFKLKEVIGITKLDGKVIDYWEKEFGNIKPVISRTGEKSYTRKDVETILFIKQMLVVERLEKNEIKRRLNNGMDGQEIEASYNGPTADDRDKLNTIKDSLKEILSLLENKQKK